MIKHGSSSPSLQAEKNTIKHSENICAMWMCCTIRIYTIETIESRAKKAFVHAWWWLAAHWALHVTCLSLYILLFLLLCSIVVVMNKTLTFLDYPCSRRFYTVVFVCFYVCTYLEPRSQSLPSSSLSWWYFAFAFLVLNKNSCRLNAFIDKNM